MSETFVADALPRGGAFYRCADSSYCGMRFPVTPHDPFEGRCPRCGAPVEMMGQTSGEAANTEALPLKPLLPHSNLHLLLDNWRSLFNVGAAFRTADGAGARHLYLCGITATPDVQRKLAKTALGAEKAVAWSYHADAVRLAARLQGEGAQLWVLERAPNAVELFDITMPMGNVPVILAAGNEVAGVDPGLTVMADRIVQLPMAGVKDSLNVAVALSVTTYWLRALELRALARGGGEVGQGAAEVEKGTG